MQFASYFTLKQHFLGPCSVLNLVLCLITILISWSPPQELHFTVKLIQKMSSRRSRSRPSGSSRISEDQINELVSKLQQLLPEIQTRRSDKVPLISHLCLYMISLHHVWLCLRLSFCFKLLILPSVTSKFTFLTNKTFRGIKF